MQIAFSTLSCPTWTLDQVLHNAVEYGYTGVELRGLGSSVDLREVPELTPSNRNAFRARFADSGLTICALGSSARFADPTTHAQSHAELRAYLALAAELNCPLVRIFGGAIPAGTERSEAVRHIADALNHHADEARAHGVKIVLETHDSFSTGAELAPILQQTGSEDIGALWDLYHPFHQGESPAETFRFLQPYVRHLHVKDGINGTYSLLGEGDTPVVEMLRLLAESDTPTDALFVSVEWEKRWIPTLAEPEIALPQYARVLRSYLEAIEG